jgi:hypothetical protein
MKMSQYTTELRYLIEQNYDLGLRDYPIFDEIYREVLNSKIKKEYYFREIGQETPARFKHHLNHKMNMIMPYYNQLYETQALKLEPLLSFRETETMERTIDTETGNTGRSTQTQTQNSTGSASSVEDSSATVGTLGTEITDEDTTTTRTENKTDVESETPAGLLSMADIKTNTYASKAVVNEGTIGDIAANDRTVSKDETVTSEGDRTVTNEMVNDSTGSMNLNETRTGTVGSVDEYLKTRYGFTGNQSKMLIEFRKTILNIDAMIIRELGDLFMGVY